MRSKGIAKLSTARQRQSMAEQSKGMARHGEATQRQSIAKQSVATQGTDLSPFSKEHMHIMNKLELRETLKDLQTLKTRLSTSIGNLEAQLTEPEKPKLRHGDYGRSKSSDGKAVDPRIYANGHSWGLVGSDHCDETPLYYVFGNIFDDLKALAAEPLEEFEIGENIKLSKGHSGRKRED